jgi:Ca2+-binding RTX toxin-like protein
MLVKQVRVVDSELSLKITTANPDGSCKRSFSDNTTTTKDSPQITFVKEANDLVLSSPNAEPVVLQNFFIEPIAGPLPDSILENIAPELSEEDIDWLIDNFYSDVPALLPEVRDGGGGAGFGEYLHRSIGDGLSMEGLLSHEDFSDGYFDQEYLVRGSYFDVAGNAGVGDVLNGADGFVSDVVAPTLTISAADLSLSSGEATTLTFEFSEDVTGFTVGDVDVTGGSLSNFAVVDGDTYTATFTQSGGAAASVTVADGSYFDVAGNAGVGDVIGGVSVSDHTASVTETSLINIASGQIAVADDQGDPLTVSLSAPASALTSGDEILSWAGDGSQLLIGSTVSLGEIIRLTIDNDGNYQITLSQPLDHPEGGGQTALEFIVVTEAADGTATATGDLTISVEDDVPVASGLAQFSINSVPTTINFSSVTSFGADGGFVEEVRIGGITYLYDAEANSVSEMGSSSTVTSYSYNTGTFVLEIETIKGETLTVDLQTGDYSYTATGVSGVDPIVNVAPEVGIDEQGGILGIAGADLLGLIDLSANQFFTARDENNNIDTVVIEYATLIGLGAFEFDASSSLAADLGLNINIVNSSFLTAASSELTITAIGGGAIDNGKLNELLGTVTFDSGPLNLGLLNSITISATDTDGLNATAGAGDLLNIGLLGATPPSEIIEGSNGGETLTGDGSDNRIYAYGGNDQLEGGDGNDILRGGSGTDTLLGQAGNDILIGGQGNDSMTGAAGVDVFLWEKNDQAVAGAPAVDTVSDFDVSSISSGGDIIDLGDMLIGEGHIDAFAGNLTNYLHFELVGVDTVLHISTVGDFFGGFILADADQQIVFESVDFVTGSGSDQDIISELLNSGKLIVDTATTDTDFLGGTTTAEFVISDNDGDKAITVASFDSTGATPPAGGNAAPEVQVRGALLGLVSLDQQDLIAFDLDGNLESVEVRYAPLLDIGLGSLSLSASNELATELGLTITIENDPGILGLIAPSSVLIITASDAGIIDNLSINEVLATVQFDQDWLGDGIDVLNSTTITATDDLGASSTDTLATLLNVDVISLLNTGVNVQIGTGGIDIEVGTAGSDRIYGFDGDDNLSGGQGNDLLRGGDGADTLVGGGGNDALHGGSGADIFRFTDVTDGHDLILDFDFAGEGDLVDLDTLFDTLGINNPGTAEDDRQALITLDNASDPGSTTLTIAGETGFSIEFDLDLGNDSSDLASIGIFVGDES